MILVFCCIGVFSLNNSGFDVYLMTFFGLLGYVFKKLDCEPAPLLLGFILGPMMEEFLRRALLLSKGDPTDPGHPADQRHDAGPAACPAGARAHAGLQQDPRSGIPGRLGRDPARASIDHRRKR